MLNPSTLAPNINMDALAHFWSYTFRQISLSAPSASPSQAAGAMTGVGGIWHDITAAALRTGAAGAQLGLDGNGNTEMVQGTAWTVAKQAVIMLGMVMMWVWKVLWGVCEGMTPDRDSVMGVVPFVFRIAAFSIAMPFAVCIGLDLIAYGIARTLHLSITARRVPRSPLSKEAAVLPAT